LLQYAPILNVQEMPNGIERSDLLIRARAALDGLLMGYREVDRAGYPQRLALVRVLARGGVSDLLKAFYGGSYWVPGWCRVRHATRPAIRAPSKALPRRRALCTNWKKPR